MVSSPHEAMHRIFQEYPGLFSRVSEALGADIPPPVSLATLAAITHADNPDVGAILETLPAALRDAPENITDPIVELTAQGLGSRPVAQQWRNLVAVDTSFHKSAMSEEIRDEGRAEGLLLLLGVRGISLTDADREKITTCTDPRLLHAWLQRAATASSAEEVFRTA
ncbi:hypothetical protein ACFZAT_20185 [Streptomyces sp. NPDC008163]|uniref:hypothetical protein n=1 Tax=Streptomyces sp. NPDC008163 TaxID=3364818 RepID=UPI0036EAABE2